MVEIGFGPMCDPLKCQLGKQGFALDEKKERLYQDLIWSINMVLLTGLATPSSCDVMRKRLIKQIAGSIDKVR